MSNPRPHHLNLAGEHTAETAEFYQQMLDLKRIELPRITDTYDANIFTFEDAGGYQYHIIPDDPGFAERNNIAINPVGGGHLAFRVDDIAAIRAKLDALGTPYNDMGVWSVKGWHQLFCTDPEGRIIEFHQIVEAE